MKDFLAALINQVSARGGYGERVYLGEAPAEAERPYVVVLPQALKEAKRQTGGDAVVLRPVAFHAYHTRADEAAASLTTLAAALAPESLQPPVGRVLDTRLAASDLIPETYRAEDGHLVWRAVLLAEFRLQTPTLTKEKR